MTNYEFNKIVERMLDITDESGKHLKMDSLIISDDNSYHKHLFNEKDDLHDLRSLCKCVLSMCIGIIMYEHKIKVNDMPLNFDTKIWPVISSKVNLTNKVNLERLEKITLLHLLTHCIGYEVKMLKSKDVKDIDPYTYLDLLCNTPILHDPGEYFLYSNGAPYMLSVFFQEITGENLKDFSKRNIFDKLGIKDFVWKNFGNYCAGATGMKLKSDDLHKLGKLIINGGNYQGRQIVPYEWMKEMVKVQRLTPSMYDEKRAFPKYGYGYLMWICKNGCYFIDGTEGQYIIMIPNRNMVITTLAHQKDVKPITQCFDTLI